MLIVLGLHSFAPTHALRRAVLGGGTVYSANSAYSTIIAIHSAYSTIHVIITDYSDYTVITNNYSNAKRNGPTHALRRRAPVGGLIYGG